jgi:hypothetical protein
MGQTQAMTRGYDCGCTSEAVFVRQPPHNSGQPEQELTDVPRETCRP